tara:strand:- start:11568 stop:13127 length:1560 start_codon:yes stop_codon:yes gene_type:complete
MSNILANNINPRSGNKITIGNVNTTVAIAGTATYEDVTNIDSVGLITARSGLSITSGDLTLPDAIVHSGDTNTKIRFPAADTITAETGGSERVRVKSNGNVGIGTDNPTSKLYVQGTIYATTNVDVPSGDIFCGGNAASGSESGIRMRSAGFISASRNSGFIWKGYTTGTSDATSIINSNGQAQFTQLLVGTNNSRYIYLGTAPVQVYGTGDRMMSLLYTQANSSGPMLNFTKGRSTNDNAGTIVNSGDLLGAINFIGDDGNDFHQAGGEIRCKVDGTPGSNDMPGRLEFLTTSDGAQFPTERLRITSGGDVRLAWNTGTFLGEYYDADYYMGLSFGASSRELYIDNRSNDTRADIVFRTIVGQSTPTEKLRITSDGYVTTPQQPSFSCYKNGHFNFTSNTNTTIKPWTEQHDTHSDFNATTGVFTAPVAGKYYFYISVMQQRQGNGDFQLKIYKNGALYVNSNDMSDAATTTFQQTTINAVMSLAANDTASFVTRNSTDTSSFLYSGQYTHCGGYLIG